MHPDYESRRPSRGIPSKPIGARVPLAILSSVEIIAGMERDSVSGLLIEGLMRVIDARRTDPEHHSKARMALEAQMRELQSTLADMEGLVEFHDPTVDPPQ